MAISKSIEGKERIRGNLQQFWIESLLDQIGAH